MTLSLDLVLIPTVHKPVTDQGLEETQTQLHQDQITPYKTSETTGNNNII